MREYLKELRENKGESQQSVAEKIGVTRQYYQLIESGERQSKMTIEMAKKLAAAFEVPIDTILKNENQA